MKKIVTKIKYSKPPPAKKMVFWVHNINASSTKCQYEENVVMTARVVLKKLNHSITEESQKKIKIYKVNKSKEN